MKPCPSGKRQYGSPAAARFACRKAGNRLRVYRCPDCGALHVTDADQEQDRRRGVPRRNRAEEGA